MKIVGFEWRAVRDPNSDTGTLAIYLEDGTHVRPRFVVLQTVAMFLNAIGTVLPIANMIVRNGTIDRLLRPLKNWGPCQNLGHPDDCTCLHAAAGEVGESNEGETS